MSHPWDEWSQIPGGIIKGTNPMEVRDYLWDRYKSNEWWIILCPAVQAFEVGTAIEDRFYKPKTDANRDYELTIFNDAVIVFMCFKKTRMNAQQLRDTLKLVVYTSRKLLDCITDEINMIMYSSRKDFVPEDPKIVLMQRAGENNALVWLHALFQYFKEMKNKEAVK